MNWLTGSKHSEARKLVNQLSDGKKWERSVSELLRLETEAVPALIDALQSRDHDLLPLYQDVLTKIGPAATPALTHSLLNDHPLIRGRVAEVLARTKDPQSVPALLSVLGGEYYTVRSRAALALGEIGDPKAVQPLVDALSDKEAEVRIGALIALGKFKIPRTFDRMADLLLEDPEIEVRQAAAQALGETRHVQAIPYLLEALRDSFWWYEREAASEVLFKTIENMGTNAVEPLIATLKDPEGTVRKQAAILLGRIGDARAIEPLGMALYDMHFEVGKAAAASLAGFGPRGLKILADALHHPEAWLRQHAITGLTLSGDKRIVTPLLDMLNDPDREVQKQVIQALGQLGDLRALPTLQAIAINRSDRELSSLARRAIDSLESK